jgi:hypothetical protein
MKILLGDFSAKVGREDIFKPKTGDESLHEISNDNGIRVVNFATFKNVIVKSVLFPLGHLLMEKMYNQTDHILIGRRRYTSILDV